MPSAVPLLPARPPQQWTKPTLENTHNGKTYRSTHPEVFRVEFSAIPGAAPGSEKSFSSALVAVNDIAPDTIITPLTNICQAPAKAYSSVQYGPGQHDHLELNSDLLFMNHSCDPSAYVCLPRGKPSEWCVRTTEKGLKAGEAITFFYPSTEWDMAQGFQCSCGSQKCLGEIKGANHLTLEQLKKRGWVNEHILALKEEQNQEA